MKNEIIKGLVGFLHYIHSFESAIVTKYNLDDIPFNHVEVSFPRIGEVEVENKIFNYRFHGSSCYIEADSIKLDYYNNVTSANRINVDAFYFTMFMQSFNKNKSENNSYLVSDVEKYLNELRDEGILGYSKLSDGLYELIEDIIGSVPR